MRLMEVIKRLARTLICTVTLFVFLGLHASIVSAEQPAGDDAPEISIILSGGGTRASAFAYGALLELNKTCVPLKGERTSPAACLAGKNFLNSAKRISAVSGGAITGASYISNPNFLEEFPALLTEHDLQKGLILSPRPLSLGKYLRPPVLLLTSALDTVISFASVLFPFLPIHLEFTPAATMFLTDGIFEPSQLQNVYDDVFFKGTSLEEALGGSQPDLLINATDIANGRTFTFDRDTFDCMGAGQAMSKIPLALAVAASSSLPGVFAPVVLEDFLDGRDPRAIDPQKCPLILSDSKRPPLLVDGGIADNLGVGAVLRAVFEKKIITKNQKQKHLLIIVNAGAEMHSDLPGVAGHLDDSFDTLMRDKTDLSRIVASGLLDQFGFKAIELRLSDIVTDRLQQQVFSEMRNVTENGGTKVLGNLAVQQGYELTETQRFVLKDLESSGMVPSREQIQALIAAGRAIVEMHKQDLKLSYKQSGEKKFSEMCDQISNADKYFCWPQEFTQPHLAANRIGPLVQVIAQTARDFAQKAAVNRNALVRSLKNTYLQKMTETLAVSPSQEGDEEAKAMARAKAANDLLGRTSAQALLAIRQQSRLTEYLNDVTTKVDVPAWNSVIKQFVESANSIVRLCQKPIFVDDREEKLWNELREWAKLESDFPTPEGARGCVEFNSKAGPRSVQLVRDALARLLSEKALKNTPQYYSISMRLATWLGDERETHRLYLEGSEDFPKSDEIESTYGFLMLMGARNHQSGIPHLRNALWDVRESLERIQSKRFSKSDVSLDHSVEAFEKLKEYFGNKKRRLKLLLALALATSPGEEEDDPRYVTDVQIDSWLKAHFPQEVYRQLFVGIDLVDVEGDINAITCDKYEVSTLGNPHWFYEIALEHPTLQRPLCNLIAEIRKHKEKNQKLEPSGVQVERAATKWPEWSDVVRGFKVHVKKELTRNVGLARAREYVESVSDYYRISGDDKSSLVEQTYRWVQPQSETLRAFIVLLESASLPCPFRNEGVKMAKSVFKDNDSRVQFWNYPVKTAADQLECPDN